MYLILCKRYSSPITFTIIKYILGWISFFVPYYSLLSDFVFLCITSYLIKYVMHCIYNCSLLEQGLLGFVFSALNKAKSDSVSE